MLSTRLDALHADAVLARTSPSGIKTSISYKELTEEACPTPPAAKSPIEHRYSLELADSHSVSKTKVIAHHAFWPGPEIDSLKPSEYFQIKDDSTSWQECYNSAHLPKEVYELAQRHQSRVFKSKTFTDPHLQTIAVPTCTGLMLLASHYERKYGITILVCSSDRLFDAAVTGQLLAGDATTWGVIATWGTDAILHVTPYLCHKTSSGALEILQLDAANNPLSYSQFKLLELKESLKSIKCYQVLGTRQADNFSCRTDALILLKEALLDIKEKRLTDLKSYINPQRIFVGDLASDGQFEMPAAWSKSVQIASLIKQDLSINAPGSKTYSLKEHRDRFTEKITKTLTFHLESLPKEHSDHAPIAIVEEVNIHTYLNYKGKKLALKTAALVEENDLAVMMGFEHRKSLF
jgi:hypothetical protein